VSSESDRRTDGQPEELRAAHRRTVDGDKVWRQRKETVTNTAARGEKKEKESRRETEERHTFLFFSSSEHGGRVHMDLVELYLPECFTYHSDTE